MKHSDIIKRMNPKRIKTLVVSSARADVWLKTTFETLSSIREIGA